MPDVQVSSDGREIRVSDSNQRCNMICTRSDEASATRSRGSRIGSCIRHRCRLDLPLGISGSSSSDVAWIIVGTRACVVQDSTRAARHLAATLGRFAAAAASAGADAHSGTESQRRPGAATQRGS
ncbi:MAG: hypothetical protein ACR2J8_15215 [Thermomicrobiales bacterium]